MQSLGQLYGIRVYFLYSSSTLFIWWETFLLIKSNKTRQTFENKELKPNIKNKLRLNWQRRHQLVAKYDKISGAQCSRTP